MQLTANHGLKKPEPTDSYNVADFNYNMDLLDGLIKKVISGQTKIISSNQEIALDMSMVLNDFTNYTYFVSFDITSGLTDSGGCVLLNINHDGTLRFRRVGVSVTNDLSIKYTIFALKIV